MTPPKIHPNAPSYFYLSENGYFVYRYDAMTRTHTPWCRVLLNGNIIVDALNNWDPTPNDPRTFKPGPHGYTTIEEDKDG